MAPADASGGDTPPSEHGESTADESATSTVLADFELSRALTVQWLFVGLLGFAYGLARNYRRQNGRQTARN